MQIDAFNQIVIFFQSILTPIHLLSFSLSDILLVQAGDNLTILTILFAIVIIGILLVTGYWILNQSLSMLDRRRETMERSAPPPPQKKEKVGNNVTVQAKSSEISLEWVKQEYPNALLMDAQSIVKEYQAGRRNFQNAYPTALGPYDTYLKWTVLDEADFSRAVLYRAPFDGTSLLDVNFNGAYLEGASFRGAILRRANFGWADLTGADLTGADLTKANLSYASLEGTNLSKAKLTGAIITSEQLETVRSLDGAILPDGSKYS